MNIIITPERLRGSIAAIPSKSQAHRLLICAALARGEKTEIVCPASSRDIEATAACLRALGAGVDFRDGVYTVRKAVPPESPAALDCGESGSTLRFLLPVACALRARGRFLMHGRLAQRPMQPLIDCLEGGGAAICRQENGFSFEGGLRENVYSIRGDLSSQYISGLLLALPVIGGGRVELTAPVQSAPYVDMTRRAMELFGVRTELDGGNYSAAGEYISPGRLSVEGDWSNAAFWLTAGVDCTGLDPGSAQGDKRIVDCLAAIEAGGAVIDSADIPDLVPILAVKAAVSGGETRFINAGRLRLKESDRIKSVVNMLQALGGRAGETADGLTVCGTGLRGGVVNSENDHRIAMSAAIASCFCSRQVTVLDAGAVSKSYPGFWRDFAALGGRIREE